MNSLIVPRVKNNVVMNSWLNDNSNTLITNLILGSLSNYDDDHDHDHDFKKTTGLMIKTTALHVHHAF